MFAAHMRAKISVRDKGDKDSYKGYDLNLSPMEVKIIFLKKND
jgi:hypothetical protein